MSVDGAVVTLTAGTQRRAHRRARRADARRAGGLSRAGWSPPARTTQLTADSGLRRQAAAAGVVPVPARADPDVTLADRTLTIETTVTPTTVRVGAAVLRVPPVPHDPRRAARGVDADHAEHAAPAGGRPRHPHRRSRRVDRRDRTARGRSSTTTDSTRWPTVRCSRSRAATAASRSRSRRVIPQRNSSRRATTTSSASSPWPRRPTRCAAATIAARWRAAGDRAVLDQGDLAARSSVAAATPPVRCWWRHQSRRCAGAQLLDLVGHLRQPRLQRLDLIGQLDDALDPREVDALVLGQPLHLAQQVDVVLRIAPPPPELRCGLTRPSRS